MGVPRTLRNAPFRRLAKGPGANLRAVELEGVTIHVLRHSFAATAAEMGYFELTIAGLLSHSVPGVTARYAHVPDAALVAAAERVSARIAAALNGGAIMSEVIAFRREAIGEMS